MVSGPNSSGFGPRRAGVTTSVRTASNSTKKRPPASCDGHDAHRWREGKQKTRDDEPLAHLLDDISHDAVRHLVDAQTPQHAQLLETVETRIPLVRQPLEVRLDAVEVVAPRLQMIFEIGREALEIVGARDGADLGPHAAVDPAARISFGGRISSSTAMWSSLMRKRHSVASISLLPSRIFTVKRKENGSLSFSKSDLCRNCHETASALSRDGRSRTATSTVVWHASEFNFNEDARRRRQTFARAWRVKNGGGVKGASNVQPSPPSKWQQQTGPGTRSEMPRADASRRGDRRPLPTHRADSHSRSTSKGRRERAGTSGPPRNSREYRR